MESVKVTFSEEFEKKAKKKLSNKQKSKLIAKNLSRLKQEDLAKVSTRKELAVLLGFPSTQKSGPTKVARLIAQGKIIEEFESMGPNHKIFNNYYLPVTKKISQVAEKAAEAVEKIATKITISCNSIDITLENPTPEVVEAVMSKIPLQN